MPLRQTRISLLLRSKQAQLTELQAQQREIDEQCNEIEERAQAEGADLDALQQEISELEAAVGTGDNNLSEQIRAIQSEIKELEKELETIGAAEQDKPQQPSAARNNTEAREGVVTRMPPRSRHMELRARISQAMGNDELQEFTGQIRSLAGVAKLRGAVTNTEIIIPQNITEILRQQISEQSKLMKYTNFKVLKGTARMPIMGNIPEAIWTEADKKMNQLAALQLNAVDIDGYKVGGYIPIANNYLEDSDIALAAEIIDVLSKSIATGVDKAIMYGCGVKMPLGIVPRLQNSAAPRNMGTYAPSWTDLSSTHIKHLSSNSLTALGFFGEIVQGLGKAESKYAIGNKFWAMKESTWTSLQAKLLQFNAAGAIVTGAQMTMPIVGGAIEFLDFMPDNVIAGGYGNLYMLVERGAAVIDADDSVKFIEDQKVFRGKGRYDGCPTVGEGFAMFTLDTSNGATELAFALDEENPEDAYLTALSGTNLTLSPTFDKDTLSYTADVTNDKTSTTISATPRANGKVKSIKYGTTAAGTTASAGVCSLSVGSNIIEVKAIYGTSEQTYKIVVTRAGS